MRVSHALHSNHFKAEVCMQIRPDMMWNAHHTSNRRHSHRPPALKPLFPTLGMCRLRAFLFYPCTVPGCMEDDTAARHATDFGNFFSCTEGTTPQELLRAGIYSKIAIALKGGPWRKPGLVMIARAFAGMSPVKNKQKKSEQSRRKVNATIAAADVTTDVSQATCIHR